MMTLRRRLVEARAARMRVARAGRHCAADAARLRRHVRRRPLAWTGAAGGVGLAAGLVAGHPGTRLITLWHDPMVRWMVRLLTQVP